jgi:predicted dehydrogenase
LKPVKVGLIGSGKISYTYLNTLVRGGFTIVDMVGCSDEVAERSKMRAEAFGIRQMTNEEILNDPEIEIVVNTTQIWRHNEVNRQILEAGKHVYVEKPVDTNFGDAKAICDFAESKGLRVGAAPDTYMGSAYQTARKLIDDGMIGRPLFAHAMCFRGYGYHERDGDFPFPEVGTKGTSIPYDMSGYYINALVFLLGPVKRVSGYSRFIERSVPIWLSRGWIR